MFRRPTYSHYLDSCVRRVISPRNFAFHCALLIVPQLAGAQSVPLQPPQNAPMPPPSAAPLPPTTTTATTKGAPSVSAATDASRAINVKDAEIGTILKVFSRRTKRNYILDERVKGKVTMFLPGEVSTQDSLRILDSVLALKGFTTVPIANNLWKVIPSREAKQSTVPTLGTNERAQKHQGSVVTKLVRLNYVSAEEVQPILTNLVSPDGLVTAYGGSNSLVLIDYADNVQRLSEMLTTLDIPFYDQDITMIPVKHADAVDVVEKLRDLLLEESGGQGGNSSGGASAAAVSFRRVPGPPGQPPQVPNGTQNFTPYSPSPRRVRAPKILADERTNSIIAVADDETMGRIRALVSELDSKIDRSTNRFFVYRCQHADAEQLAQVLSGLVGGGSTGGTGTGGAQGSRSSLSGGGAGGGGGPGGSSGGSSGGISGRSGQQGRTSSRLGQTQRQPGEPRQTNGSNGPTTVQLGDNFSLTADASTNSLIINSSKSDYEKIVELIKDLDIKRRQVLVEAMILEVGVDGNSALGTDFLTSTGGADGAVLAQSNLGGQQGLSGLLSNPSQLSGFSVAAASAGTISLPGGTTIPSQAVLITAAKSNSNVNVLSAPTLLATDNEESEIIVGQNVPFLASTSTSQVNLNNTFNQINRQDVGITLRLTPQINSNDFVTLRLFTDVSAVVPSADSTLGPTTTVRSSETTVITKDSQMIVIGGLIADQTNDSESGVPFLKDIPVIGHAFRRTTDRITRTNLLTFITPRIIKDQYDARDSTVHKRDQLETTIQDGDIYPTRTEILRNPLIDDVAELSPPPKSGPGTILPPKERASNEPIQVDEAESAPRARGLGVANGVRKGKGMTSPAPAIIPEIPVQQQGQVGETLTEIPLIGADEDEVQVEVPAVLPQNTVLQKDESSTALSQSASRSDQRAAEEVAQGSNPFVVLTVVNGNPTAESLPFKVDANGTFGVQLPAGSISPFVLGKQYRFGSGANSVVAKVASLHPTREQAKVLYRLSESNWHVASPFEVMSFGTGPWYQEN